MQTNSKVILTQSKFTYVEAADCSRAAGNTFGDKTQYIGRPQKTMKVLFVCHANVGRSQVAQAYFGTISKHDSNSAGIAVNERIAAMKIPSRKLRDNSKQRSVEYVSREFGLDIAEKERQQLTPEMIEKSDLVIVIAEKEKWPDYLDEGGKVVFWNIPDAFGMPDDIAEDVYSQVKRRVEQLVGEIG